MQLPPHPLCFPQLLAAHARHSPEAPAILAQGRQPLTYQALDQRLRAIRQALHAMGLRRHDRVAVVLPNGPDLAVALVAVAATAICMPLNPAYSQGEFDVYLTDLSADALIVPVGSDSPARTAAQQRALDIIEFSSRPAGTEAGVTLSGARRQRRGRRRTVQPDDVAFILQTSGTTSRPKRVPLTHANICRRAFNKAAAHGLTAHDRCLNVMPLWYGHGLIHTLLVALISGSSIVCAPTFEPEQFFQWLAEFCPTWYTAVPAMHQAILAQAVRYREIIRRCPLRFVRSATASLPAAMIADLERVFNAPVTENYGLTETAVIACNGLPPFVRKPGAVGVTLGLEVAIMNADGIVQPPGTRGEIVVRGPTVIQGYDCDPGADQEAFTGGWFRTGDEGYLDADGYLFVTGRLKEIINRGGEKIAPWEVEETLMAHPAVLQAMAFAVPHPRLGEDVGAAVVLRPSQAVTAEELRQFVVARLAPFKVPSQVVIVDELPTGVGGKPQRHLLAEQLALLKSGPPATGASTDDGAPPTPLAEILLGLWGQVLAVDCLGIHDNFFQLGGDSILTTQLLSRIYEATHVEVSLAQFFAGPTVADVAELVEKARHIVSETPAPPLQPRSRDGPLPLSYAQQRLWFIEQLGLSGHAYHVLQVLEIRGTLQVAALQQSIAEIMRRHEILRTTFVTVNGQPRQRIGPPGDVPFSIVELRGESQRQREAQVRQLARAEAQRPFDLAHGPLLRGTLLRWDAETYGLLLTMHHIVCDAWSQSVFWSELATLYRTFASGRPSPLPEPALQYADFAHWQRQWLQGEALNRQVDYWVRQLAELPALQVPLDRPRALHPSFRGARHRLKLPPALTHRLKNLSQRQGVTLFMTLLAAFQALLHRYSAQDDIAVGSFIANRHWPEIETSLGFFVNTLVLRTDLSGDPTFVQLLGRVRDVALAAYQHQDLPFEKLVEALQPQRDLSRNPLFQVVFSFQNAPQQVWDFEGLSVRPLELDPETAKFDLTLELRDTPQGLSGWFEYSTAVFEAATIARMAGHWHNLLQAIATDPNQRLSCLPLLTGDERQRLLREWNDPIVMFPDNQCLHERLATQVERTPEAVAMVCEGQCLTYRQLQHEANQLAHHLMALGLKPSMVVGLCLPRGLQWIIALLGVLKAGAAYLPLDPTHPRERLAFMLADAQAFMVLTDSQCMTRLPAGGVRVVCLDAQRQAIAGQPTATPLHSVSSAELAAVIYTSGSTGQPKGVALSHRQVLNRLSWMWQTYPFAAGDVACQKTAVSFVDSLWEWLGPLLAGVKTVIFPDDAVRDPGRFVRALAEHQVTRLWVVPSWLRILLERFPDLQQRLPRLRFWVSSGEAVSPQLYRQFQQTLPDCLLYNLYGLTEAWDVSWYEPQPRHEALPRVPIGRPIANMQAYVLDAALQPVPIGVPGELYVGGASLAQGYLNRPELTAERFVPHPFSDQPGARLLKTGDMARYLPDGTLEHLGRLDDQVKIRGCRIELGEIETALRQHPGVRETAVLARTEDAGETRLVAYLVSARERAPTVTALRRFLRNRLPDFMMPAHYVWLEALPLTTSGKLNRQALPAPAPSRPALDEPFAAPQTAVEQEVAAMWSTLLGVARIGRDDNFFELGGHSLLATQLLARISDAMQVEISLLSFFEMPTVAALATNIATARQPGQVPPYPALRPLQRVSYLPASIAQEHMWMIAQALQGLPLFNIFYTLRLRGRCDVEILQRACDEVVNRHEMLRTTFAEADGQLVLIIAPALKVPVAVTDLRALTTDKRADEVQQLAEAEAQEGFDLEHGPLLRLRLLCLDEHNALLLLTMHHIIADGWSLGVLVHELAVLYDAYAAGEPSPLPALRLQYADFAHWQRQWRDDVHLRSQLDYWLTQLRAPWPALHFPSRLPPTRGSALQTARQSLSLPRRLSSALKMTSPDDGATLFMKLVAAVNLLLHAYTGQEDLRVATLVANRHHRALEDLIGLFVNTVILRTDLHGDPTGAEVLRRVRAATLAAYAHQDLPFESLLQTLEHERGLKRAELCQVMLVLQNAMLRPLPGAGRALSFHASELSAVMPPMVATTFDLVFMVREQTPGLALSCIYKSVLFDDETIARLLRDFRYALARLVSQPERPLSGFTTGQGR